MEFFRKLFDADFMPHGHCYFWKPEIVWTNAISDSIIALAYLTIPLSLVYIIRIRKDFRYYWIIALFALFILGCGATHILDVINIWNPLYRLDALIRVITALASIGTAIMLVKITPKILLIPNAEEFKNMNIQLTELNSTLEDKVYERTEELQKSQAALLVLTEELKFREEQLKLITNTIPAYISYIDSNEIFLFANDCYKDLGTDPSVMVGRRAEEVLGKKSYEYSKKFIKEALEGKKVSFENNLITKNGKLQHVNISFIPDKSTHGTVRGFAVLGVDMTERIQYEVQLKEKNSELLRINSDLDNFIYTASHDLKSPISNIEGLVINMREEIIDKNGDLPMLLDMTDVSVKRLKSTIADLANISRVQKNVEEDKELIQIEPFIDDFIKDHLAIIQQEKIIIHKELEVTSLFFSTKNFRSIIYNLLSNSIKYRNPATPLTIIVRTEMNSENQVLLSVQDNGLGFDIKQKDKIFAMFKRLHTHVEGTGIGLYILKRIIENSGDKIEVESEINRGTTFKIFFNNKL